MRISDLIGILQRKQEQEGDIQVYINECWQPAAAFQLGLGEICIEPADTVLDADKLAIDVICSILEKEDENILLIG